MAGARRAATKAAAAWQRISESAMRAEGAKRLSEYRRWNAQNRLAQMREQRMAQTEQRMAEYQQGQIERAEAKAALGEVVRSQQEKWKERQFKFREQEAEKAAGFRERQVGVAEKGLVERRRATAVAEQQRERTAQRLNLSETNEMIRFFANQARLSGQFDTTAQVKKAVTATKNRMGALRGVLKNKIVKLGGKAEANRVEDIARRALVGEGVIEGRAFKDLTKSELDRVADSLLAGEEFVPQVIEKPPSQAVLTKDRDKMMKELTAGLFSANPEKKKEAILRILGRGGDFANTIDESQPTGVDLEMLRGLVTAYVNAMHEVAPEAEEAPREAPAPVAPPPEGSNYRSLWE